MQTFIIITPCLDANDYIDDTITSVVTQSGDFAIRYHVQDGGSKDGTVEKLEAWKENFTKTCYPILCKAFHFSYSSKSDCGMYEAINRGFNRNAGEISDACMMTWINAGDRLNQGALQTITSVRRAFQDTNWISGAFAQISDEGCPIAHGHASVISQRAIAAGLYDGRHIGFLQQEGVFWSYSLWSSAGGQIDPSLRLVGDYDLWRHFAAYSPCVSVNAITGLFRRHPGRLTSDISQYFAEIDRLLEGDAQTIRDNTYQQLKYLTESKDGEKMVSAGFVGPIVMWNSDDECWEMKRAILPFRPRM